MAFEIKNILIILFVICNINSVFINIIKFKLKEIIKNIKRKDCSIIG